MGQKTHPLGFRLVTTQRHQSFWYSDFKNYAYLIEQDFKIRQLFDAYKRSAQISNIHIDRAKNRQIVLIEIVCANASFFSSNMLDNLSKKVGRLINDPETVHLIRVKRIVKPDLVAGLLATFAAEELEKRQSYKKVMQQIIERAMQAGAIGVKVKIGGRLNGAEIARSEWAKEGRIPLHTLRAHVDYSHQEAHTIYGIIGIKVWVFLGES